MKARSVLAHDHRSVELVVGRRLEPRLHRVEHLGREAEGVRPRLVPALQERARGGCWG